MVWITSESRMEAGRGDNMKEAEDDARIDSKTSSPGSLNTRHSVPYLIVV